MKKDSDSSIDTAIIDPTTVDPFAKLHKLVHNDEFPKFEVLHKCSLNTVKLIKIQ